jgi:hypothetical protein
MTFRRHQTLLLRESRRGHGKRLSPSPSWLDNPHHGRTLLAVWAAFLGVGLFWGSLLYWLAFSR